MILAEKKKQLLIFAVIFALLLVLLIALVIALLWPSEGPALPLLGAWQPEIFVFFFIALLLMLVFQLGPWGALTVLLAVTGVAGVYELVQGWTPFRDAGLADWASNSWAALMGVVLGGLLGRAERSLLDDIGRT